MEKRSYVDHLTARAPFDHKEPEEKSNILFVTTDMVPPEFWDDGRFAAVRSTPALDELRQDGVTFTNAFATAPVCSPSRAAFLTGRHSYIMTNSERGHDGHEMHLRDTDTIFPEYLSVAGYHTRHVGKSHVGRHKFMDAFGENDSPWDRWSPPWFDDDAYLSYLRDLGLGPISFEREIYGVSATGTGQGNFYGGWIAGQNGKPFPIEGTYPWYLAERAIKTLQSRPAGKKPFYLELDFFAPHQPFAIPGGMAERELAIRKALSDPAGYTALTENGFAAPWEEPRVYRLYRKNWGLTDPATVRDYMTANLLQYEVIDRALDRLFSFLREEGVYDETTIIYTADHGEMNCNLALLDKGAFLNPHVLRVPLTLKPSASHRALFGQPVCPATVSLIDIAPTVCALAGITPADRFDGVPLQDTAAGVPRPAEKPMISEVWSHVIPNPCVATVIEREDGDRYLFSFNICDDVSELYRLDPEGRGAGELENLFTREEYAAVRDVAIRTLTSRLAGDERWKGYLAYAQLVFADTLGDAGDMQKFQ